jgi:hypothetical protein
LRRAGWTGRALVLARRGELVAAERAYARGLRLARDDYEAAQAARLAALRRGKAAIETLRRGRKLGSYGRVVLFDDRIELPRATIGLSRELTAIVGSAPTLAAARPAAIARLDSGKEERRLLRDISSGSEAATYLLIEGSSLAAVGRCGEDVEAAREFAARVNVAALNVEQAQRELRLTILDAERELLDQDERHEHVVMHALRRYQERRDDTRGVERARRELEAALEGAEEVERLRAGLIRLASD